MRRIIIVLLITVSCNSNIQNSDYFLPLSQENVWYYQIKGYSSYQKYIGTPPVTSHQNIDDDIIEWSETYTPLKNKNDSSKLDTIRIFIESIKKLGEDSLSFKFNLDFVRFWGSEIVYTKNGYKLSADEKGNSYYLIKLPIQLNYTWVNKFYRVNERCTITTIDTTVTINKKRFYNCFEITIHRSVEGSKSLIKIYFNKKFGLVYYKDFNNEDELRLIKMGKR